MNTKNNKRRRASIEKMEKAFIGFLQTRELNQITVSDICKEAGVNRSTFYANYADVYALADSIREKLEGSFAELYREENTKGFNSQDYLKIFRHIRENQIFYKTYFKLGYDNEYRITRYDRELAERHFGNQYIEYHMEFFRAGITKIIKMWLENGCKETAEDMVWVLKSEYLGRESAHADATWSPEAGMPDTAAHAENFLPGIPPVKARCSEPFGNH